MGFDSNFLNAMDLPGKHIRIDPAMDRVLYKFQDCYQVNDNNNATPVSVDNF